MSKEYDVVVIGAGPAGYVSAIRAAQLGMNVVCIDQWLNPEDKPSLGGTCLNAGCIPSKALLESSELYHQAQGDFAAHGLQVGDVSMDIAQMQKRKTKVVNELTGGIASLFKANGVESRAGTGQITGTGQVKCTDHEGKEETLQASSIIIASGSAPVELPMARFDDEYIVDSRGALAFDEVPGKLGVIGAGIIGVELGSVWSRLGAEVTLIEALDDFMPTADRDVSKEAVKTFKKQGLDIQLGSKVESTQVDGSSVKVSYSQDDKTQELTFDRLIVAAGRRPNTDGLMADGVDVKLSDKGFVEVDANYRTSMEGIYAVGDVVGQPMLAHKGMDEGVALAEMLAGEKPEVNYETIPSIVYTSPEMAWAGKTEAQIKEAGIEYRAGQIPFAANGRAKAMAQQEGFVKILADADSDEILGVHMIGPNVSELIQEMIVAMEYRASSEDIARIMHGHPTLTETVHEAALAVDGRPIHFPPPRRKKK